MKLEDLINAYNDKTGVSYADALAYQNQLSCWTGVQLFFVPLIGTDKGVLADESDLYYLPKSFAVQDAKALAGEYIYSR